MTMKPEVWDQYYVKILDYFGFSREDDEEAARLLSSILPGNDISLLTDTISGSDIIVAGNAPSLPDDIKKTDFEGKIVIAADAAARVMKKGGVIPNIVFTDLDGLDDDVLEMNEAGTILAVHAHGDNMPLVKSWVPKMKGPVVGTTQSTPLENVYNFGGFSDGDRGVFAAYELGAKSVSLIGFDLDDKSVDPVKHGKLMIARKLLHLLGHDI
ncbi:MAG: 6-hydroxymethylpterin diphosphokinase MptE-like protein [Methanocorpusculum sp.]|nr:6-hydroxymethylpterin diphosphokinase MptE-like protein [Methanocorpusculum sp.]